MGGTRLRTTIDVLVLLVFVLSVVVQVDDPDPWPWIAVYGLAVVACGLTLAGRIHWAFPTLIALATLGWSLTLAPGVLGEVPFRDMFGAFEMESVAVEESREMYGLWIVAGWMAVLAWRARRRSASGDDA